MRRTGWWLGVVMGSLVGSTAAGAQTPEAIQKELDEGRLLDARQHATALTVANPGDCRAWRLLGDVDRKLTLVRDAATAYRQGLEACEGDKDLLRALGFLLDEAEQYEEATIVLAKLWDLDPSDPNVASRLGADAYRSGRCAEGRKALEALLATHPDRTIDRLALAQLLSRTCHDDAAAALQFEKLRAEKPDDPTITCAWIYALANAGKADEAASAAAQAVGGGSAQGCVYAAWGRALETAADSLMAHGDVDGARQRYQQAIDPLTKGSADPVFGKYCAGILAEVKYKESPMEELTP